MANSKLIEGLNVALNKEVTTLLRYMLQAAALKGMESHPLRTMYLTEVLDEVGHAQYLANKISMLGGTPKLNPDLTPPPEGLSNMVNNDIEEERKSVAHYMKLATLSDEAGLFDLKLKMEELAGDEATHADEMERLLG